MANYCGECMLWVGSQDVNKYGERWCPHSRRYEKSNQNTYGCKGFVAIRRAILTKVCEILELPPEEYFCSFDMVKQRYLIPEHMELLTAYNETAPELAEKLGNAENRAEIARMLLERFIQPAKVSCDAGENVQAVEKFGEMMGWMKAEMEDRV